MKTINLFQTTISIKKDEFLNALNKDEVFTIHCDGTLNGAKPILYKGNPKALSPLKTTITNILGNDYQVEENVDYFTVCAAKAWQHIITLNKELMEYDDTSADGIAEFATKELETIGWHATDFNISYREMVNILEKECEGILLCIENETNFSGIGFVDDKKHAQEILFNFCKSRIIHLLENDDDFSKERLTIDEKKSALFFGIEL